MTIFDELCQILGTGVSQYPFLIAFGAILIFCFICIEFMGVISSIFKHLGGWR